MTTMSKIRGYDSNLSRRELLKTLGLLGSGAMLGGLACSHQPGPENSDRTLRMFGTGTLDIGNKWQRLQTDLGLNMIFKDNENDVGPVITKMITLDAAEQYDLGGLQGGAEAELAKAGKILPWDLAMIPNFNKMWPWVRDIKWAKWEGKQYGLPIVVNADSIIYLPQKTGVVDSYHAVFDRHFKGKASMEDAWINSVIFTAIYLKETAQAKLVNPGDLEEDELYVVMEFLTKQKKDGQFLKFWSGWEEGVSLLESGAVWVMTGWEPIVYAVRQKGVKADYAVPKEGYEGWSNNLLLHVGAKSRNLVEAAHKFADWELSGYYGCSLALQRGYVVPNEASITYAVDHAAEFNNADRDHISRTVANVRTKFLEMKGQVYWQNVRPKNFRLYEDLWSQLRAA